MFVFITISMITLSHFSAPIDSREIQTKLVYLKITDCFVEKGVLSDSYVMNRVAFNFSRDCNFSEGAMNLAHNLVIVKILNSSNGETNRYSLGDKSLFNDCEVVAGRKAAQYPYCFNRRDLIYLYEGDKKQSGYLDVFIASQNTGERISSLDSGAGGSA